MDTSALFGISMIALGCASVGALISLFISHRRSSRALHALSPFGNSVDSLNPFGTRAPADLSNVDMLALNEAMRKKLQASRPQQESRDLFFQAGMFSEEERTRFTRWKTMLMVISPLLGGMIGFIVNPSLIAIFFLIGLVVGIYIPISTLQRAITRRHDEMLYYLPIVIEQLVIGVSSSLDIGPCIQWVVAMADERDSHNPVTELLRYAQQYVRSGASLDEALTEVSELAGHAELKHAFMSLAQVSRHGGEVSRQLQELANSVASQREASIEGRIRTLEIKATGPVALVFLAFMAILLTSFGVKIMNAFG